LFVALDFDDLPASAAHLAREWEECVRRRRRDLARMDELLAESIREGFRRELRRLGVLPDLTATTIVGFGNRHGRSAAEAMPPERGPP
jgi:thymidylate synthase ThyX